MKVEHEGTMILKTIEWESFIERYFGATIETRSVVSRAIPELPIAH